ncbi:nonribosomal peptide synthase, putative [Trichophyton verrucosum HKI 0517]|uniref:Nonribosomal peptide synthase, putative n=1 Tax=Trichophyton verrucosum (strain HKI 0517) TaxID=663202 RepID=D4DKW3_TRIVH|nr:nonribosomal peptide synthase, putative [Trichophyton verrucosum HKI 0517]EFE37496.1 nonribosomal peptide synthase, putative [Trichophyton verrucosum HKI 0517]
MPPYLSTQAGFPLPVDQFENHPTSKVPIVQVKEELAQFCFELPSDLEDFRAKSGITSLQILLAGWAITLRYYTASESVTVGNIVWHCDGSYCNGQYEVGLDDDTPLLRAVEQFRHQSDCDSRDSNSTSPDTLMADTFVIQNLSTSALPFNRSPVFNIRGCKIPTSHTITVDIVNNGLREQVELDIYLNESWGKHIVNMSRTFEQVVSEMLRKPTGKLGDLDLCSAWDITTLTTWNGEISIEGSDKCVHDMISLRCAQDPNYTAIQSWDGNISYGELDELSSALAVRLVASHPSIGPETFIPLLFEKSKWTVVSLLAVIKAGAGFVLLDPSLPLKRLEDICRQVKATVVITSPQHSVLASTLETPIFIASEKTIGTPTPLDYHRTSAQPTNPLYAIFTSGSTGNPKGIVIEHGSFLSSALAYIKTVDLNRTSRVLQFASYAFDVSVSDILYSLLSGATLCIPSDAERNNSLVELIDRLKPNWMDLTPSFLRSLSPADLYTVRTIVLSGEAMTQDVIAKWDSEVRLLNVYGPAECSIQSTVQTVVAADPVNIGHAITGASWVVSPSDHNRLMPIGAIGELLIEGSHVGRGYIGNPENTQKVFIKSTEWLPGFRKDHQALYKTGDLVQYQPDGSMRYIGRKDTQVKLRGQRIELAEVEHYARECFSEARDVVTEMVKPQYEGGTPMLIAFVHCPKDHIGQNASQSREEAIFAKPDDCFRDRSANAREKMANSLPNYMIPTIFIPLARVPLSATGKTDRKLLRSLATALPRVNLDSYSMNINKSRVLPSTDMEKCLHSVFAEVLNLAPEMLSIDDDFFRSGGDSITAMQVITQCRKQGVVLALSEIFRLKTIMKIAKGATFGATTTLSRQQQEDHIGVPFGLSPIQDMYFEDCPEGHNDFNQSFFLAFARPVGEVELTNALELLITRHSMLRARFHRCSEGKWTQSISRDVPGSYRLRSHQLSRREEVTAIMVKSQTRLNPQTGPLFSVDFIEIANDKTQYVFLVAHHLVIDLVSWRILLAELEEVLETGTISQDVPIPFQAWYRLQSEYAQKYLPPQKALHFRPIPIETDYWGMKGRKNIYGNVIHAHLKVDEGLTSKLLKDANLAFDTQPVEILHASLLHSFMKCFPDREPPLIFNEGHGREPWDSSIDISRTVGWFTTIWPTEVLVDDRKDVVDLVRRVKDGRRKVPGRGWPYFASRYLNDEGREAFNGYTPFEVVFNFHGLYQQLERKDGLLQQVPWKYEASCDNGPNVVLPGLFEITAVIIHGSLQFEFMYSREMKHQDAIGQWIRNCACSLREAVEGLIAHEESPTLSDFPLLPLTYQSLTQLTTEVLPQSGLSLADIDEIYPCLPMQEGILLSQLRNNSHYQTRTMIELISTNGSINMDRIRDAWQQVTDRHSSLRTIFVKSSLSTAMYDQVVLKSMPAQVNILPCAVDNDAVEILHRERRTFSELGKPLHLLTVCANSNGRVLADLGFNHAIIDGMSISTLLEDFKLAYLGKLPPSQGPRYSEFVTYIQSMSQQDTRNYWMNYLRTSEPCLFPVITDGISLISEEEPNSLERVEISFDCLSKLQDWCRAQDVTLSTLLRVSWALVLRCFTHMDDVCFGYVNSGREAPIDGIEGIVGLCANIITCRFDMSTTRRIADIIQSDKVDFLNSLSHQNASLADIMHEINMANQTLFNTVLSIQNKSTAGDEKSDFMVDELYEVDPTEYDISVNIEISGAGKNIDAYLGYWTSRLSQWQANNISTTLSHIVSEIVAASTLPTVGQLDYFAAAHKWQVAKWNIDEAATVNSCTHELIQTRSTRQPEAQAICSWDGNLTYRELDELSSKLATKLIGAGVKPEAIVPLYFEKCKWAPVAILAVLKAGGAFVLLDPSYPKQRLQKIYHDTNATLVVTSPHLSTGAEQLTDKVIIAHEDISTWDIDEASLKMTPVTPKNAMYSIFTSGSTGEPKGVIIEHAAFLTSAQAHTAALHLDSGSRVFQFASYTFDASVCETLSVLLVGGCICIPSERDRWNDISGAVARLGANWILMTPALARSLDPSRFPSLKTMVVGGEAITSAETHLWCDKLQLLLAYGPSECSVMCSITDPVSATTDPRNLGRVFSGSSWIVDQNDHNKLVPIGGVGELIIEGPLIAREYINRPEKTAEAFIEDPSWLYNFRWGQGSRFYKTGDLVQYAIDGTIRYIGRKDTQVKLRGQRLELGEIEHRLRRAFRGAKDVIVDVVLSTVKKTRILIGFVYCGHAETLSLDKLWDNPSEEFSLLVQEAKKRLQKELPGYMIPEMILPLASIPLTKNGKCDRKLLLKEVEAMPAESLLMLSNETLSKSMPSNAIQRKLQSLVCQVLSQPEDGVGMDDSFFHLGGDSISAMKLVGAARAEKLRVTVADIFQNPRLEDLASVLQRHSNDQAGSIEPFSLLGSDEARESIIQQVINTGSVEREEIEDIYPCTPLQEGMMALSIKIPGAYTMQHVFQLPESVDTKQLQEAWDKTINAHPILRTRIYQGDSGKAQQVVVREKFCWQQSSNLNSYLDQDRKRPMRLMEPLIRLALIKEQVDTPRQYMALTLHHALYDGWSESLLLGAVEAAYRGEELKLTPFSPLIKHISDGHEAAGNFWRTQFSDIKSAAFPSLPSENYSSIPSSFIQRSVRLGSIHRNGFTLNSQLRLAWVAVISQYTACEDVVFGVTVTGRDAQVSGIEMMTGPALATVPLRVRLQSSVNVRGNLQQIQDQFAQSIPFEQFGLQNISALGEDAAAACRFNSLLLVQPSVEDCKLDIFNHSVAVPDQSTFDTYPLTLQCTLGRDVIEIQAIFDANVLPHETMERILSQFVHLFEEISKNIDKPMGTIGLVGPEDMRMLKEWNGKPPQKQDLLTHELIQRQCEQQPNAQAVCAWDGDLTYGQLNELSGQLAAYLNRLGVGTEMIIPLCFEKSKWTTVAMLGVIRAGAAFVLLDPSAQPVQRMSDMCQQVSASLILSSAKYASCLQQLSYQIVTIAEAEPIWTTDISTWRPPSISPSNAIYSVFTSGSTGKPKCITIEHLGFASSADANREILGLGSKTRVLQFSSYSFDVCIENNLTTLVAGGCICVPSEADCKGDLAKSAREFKVTYADLTPSVARILQPEDMPTVEIVILGGEAMASEDIARWSKKVRLVNAYGPAECSVTSTIQPDAGHQASPANIGRPCAARCWVVDRHDQSRLLPIGAVGELIIEGPIVGRGYLNNATASEAFIEAPGWLSTIREGESYRMYKTGDLVQYNSDGTLTYIGRKDLQVKLNGQRIELGEVESHVRRCFRASRDVVAQVVIHSQLGNKPRLVAFVWQGHEQNGIVKGEEPSLFESPSDQFRADVKLAEEKLRQSVPNFMVPTTFIPLSRLPIAASGKTDRKGLLAAMQALSREDIQAYSPVRERRPVSTDMERKIQAIWAKALKMSPADISAGDSFFQLGGDSITAMKVAAAARTEGVFISLQDLFQNAPLEKLAKAGEVKIDVADEPIDWKKEVAVCPELEMPLSRFSPRQSSGDKIEVVLTGCTGLLGNEILKQLEASAEISKIHCVAIRAKGTGVARNGNLNSEKVVTYTGDLSLPRLGLSKEDEETILARCGAIIHCGALVSFVQGYQTLYGPNVASTKELARWAMKRFIPYHFVSTAGVGHLSGADFFDQVSVSAYPPPSDGSDGYTASKWASEVYLENVNEKFGLPIYIHRPTNILGTATSQIDVVNNLLTYSRKMKIVPRFINWTGYLDLINVKYVASDIIESVLKLGPASSPSCTGRYKLEFIHEGGEIVVPIQQLGEYLGKEAGGAAFETVTLDEWVARANESGINPLVSEYLKDLRDQEIEVSLPLAKCNRTMEALAKLNMDVGVNGTNGTNCTSTKGTNGVNGVH